MGENSEIAWTDHTFNPWIGCTKVSAGCLNCYAERDFDKRRHFAKWGDDGTRVKTSPANWLQPMRWDRKARDEGKRKRVFCASLADVFEPRKELHRWRLELFDLIRKTPQLDWLLLTKRPELFECQVVAAMQTVKGDDDSFDDTLIWLSHWLNGKPPDNVWLGTSIEDQASADQRIPLLLQCPAAVRFLSIEPLLGEVDFSRAAPCGDCGTMDEDGVYDGCRGGLVCLDHDWWAKAGISWCIVGGESGRNARPCNVDWIRSIVQQCKAANVPCFVKQLGAQITGPWKPGDDGTCVQEFDGPSSRWRLKSPKGGDICEWPADLQVREFPEVSHAN